MNLITTQSWENNFWSKVSRGMQSTECWEWKGARDKNGYGLTTANDKTFRAPRLAYALVFGKVDEGLQICHTCDNPPCVNPFHMFLGTEKDNALDKIRKKRHHYCENHPLTKISNEKVREIIAKYDTGNYKQVDLAEEYGVNQGFISKVILGKSWKNAGTEEELKKRESRPRKWGGSIAKMNQEIADSIREERQILDTPVSHMASRYGVSRAAIYHILNNRTYTK